MTIQWPRTKRAIYVILLCVALVASGFAIYNQFASDNTASSLAAQVVQVCTSNRAYAEQQGLNCAQAGAVKDNNSPTILQGPKGEKGDKGDPGTDGNNGTNGQNGTPGVAGTNGTNGDPGVNGTNGQNGANGEDGIDGIDGQPGQKGDKGDTGAQGEKGDKGDPGEPGKDGSPPKSFTFPVMGTYVTCTLNSDGTSYSCAQSPGTTLKKGNG